MDIEQIASRISELTGEQVSPAQLTHLPVQKARDEGFKPINSKLEVLADYNDKPISVDYNGTAVSVNFNMKNRKFRSYQVNVSATESLDETWTEILTTFEDMLVNPENYYDAGDKLLDLY